MSDPRLRGSAFDPFRVKRQVEGKRRRSVATLASREAGIDVDPYKQNISAQANMVMSQKEKVDNLLEKSNTEVKNEDIFKFKGKAYTTAQGNPRISKKEFKCLKLHKRYSPLELVKKLRFPLATSRYDRVDLSMTPYLVLPISWLRKSGIHWIKMIAPTQSGKTLLLQTAVADAIDQSPGNVLYMMPTESTADRGFKDKIVEMIKATPELYAHAIHPIKTTLTKKKAVLDNMTIYAIASNSPAEISSITCSLVIADEVRAMALSVKDESNALKLLADRLTTYLEDGLGMGLLVSTPSIKGDLLHLQISLPDTTVFFWYTHCPACERMQVLDFFVNMFDNGEAVPICKCKYCGNHFEDIGKKRKMNANGRYGVEGLDGTFLKDFPEPKPNINVLFWYTSLNSPFRSFLSIYKEYMTTKDDVILYKNFIQAWLAQFFENDLSTTTIDSMYELINHHLGKGVVPVGTKVITAGIDSQDMNFYCVVEAHLSLTESVIIDTFKIESNMYTDTVEVVKQKFTQALENKIYYDVNNSPWAIGLYAIDTGGHRTGQIYSALKEMKKVMLCKGRPIDQNIEPSARVENLYLVNTNNYLELTESRTNNKMYQIYGSVDSEYLNQYIGIRKVLDVNKKTGKETIIWKKLSKSGFDYRMAHVHSQIALDVKLDGIVIREQLSKQGYSYNPISPILSLPAVNKKPKPNRMNSDSGFSV